MCFPCFSNCCCSCFWMVMFIASCSMMLGQSEEKQYSKIGIHTLHSLELDGSGVVFFCSINQSASDVPGYTDCELKNQRNRIWDLMIFLYIFVVSGLIKLPISNLPAVIASCLQFCILETHCSLRGSIQKQRNCLGREPPSNQSLHENEGLMNKCDRFTRIFSAIGSIEFTWLYTILLMMITDDYRLLHIILTVPFKPTHISMSKTCATESVASIFHDWLICVPRAGGS